MITHALQARTRRGSTIEIGVVGSLETAVRLAHALEDGLGDRFDSFSVVEREVEIKARSVTVEELQAPPQRSTARLRAAFARR